MCQLEIAHLLKFINDEEFASCESDVTSISRLLAGLKKSLKEKENKINS